MNPTTLADWLAHTERLHPQVMDLGLSRVNAVLAALGWRAPAPVISVAGTNGKGSTCGFIESIARAAGVRTGLYTSPHLVRYNERIRIDGAPVPDNDLCQAFSVIEAVRGATPLTGFEYGTLVALEVFARHRVELLILEVGLGGRLDAVNAVDPSVAIVTGIDLDHQAWLGHTREAIGFEKAGIFRAGRLALGGDPDPPASIAAQAQAVGATLWQIDREIQITPQGHLPDSAAGAVGLRDLPRRRDSAFGSWSLTSPLPGFWGRIGGLAPPSLTGDFQVRHAALAITALAALGSAIPLTLDAVQRGLVETRLAGRFEIRPGPPETILDVAHNPQSARALARHLAARPSRGQTRAVFGMLADKDMAGVVAALDPLVDDWYGAAIHEARGASRALLEEVLQSVRGRVSLGDSPTTAWQMARAEAQPTDRLVVFGSFVTVGEVLRLLEAPA